MSQPTTGGARASNARRRHPVVPPPTLVALAILVVGLAFLALAVATVRPGSAGADPVTTAVSAVTALAFATVGAFLVVRLPRQPIGWLLLVGGTASLVGIGAGGLADRGLIADPGSVPGAIWWAVAAEVASPVIIEAIIVVGFLFPTGRLPSVRWRLAVILALADFALLDAASIFGPLPAGLSPQQNPLLMSGFAGALVTGTTTIASVGFFGCLLLATARILIRYRRASGLERVQVRWLAASVVLAAVVFAGGITADNLTGTSGGAGSPPYLVWLAFDLVGALLPLAIGIAVLRYRLYEIDRLVSRTISYGLLTVILGGLFVGAVVLLQALLVPVTRRNDVAVAGSTLLIVSLFQPLRRRLQRLVDHRFNRGRYDADVALAAFGARVRGEVDLDAVRGATMAAAVSTLEPASISTWLRS